MHDLKKFLIEKDLSIEQYFILSLLQEDPVYLEQYLQKVKHKINKIDIFQDLLLKGYITLQNVENGYALFNIVPVSDISSIANSFNVEEDFNQKIEFSKNDYEKKWSEFISLYPKEVNGRPLHNLKEKNKLKYFKYLNSGIKHEDVIQGLNYEILVRKTAKARNQFFPEWKLLSTYINNKSWEQFLELSVELKQNENINSESIGRISRTF